MSCHKFEAPKVRLTLVDFEFFFNDDDYSLTCFPQIDHHLR